MAEKQKRKMIQRDRGGERYRHPQDYEEDRDRQTKLTRRGEEMTRTQENTSGAGATAAPRVWGEAGRRGGMTRTRTRVCGCAGDTQAGDKSVSVWTVGKRVAMGVWALDSSGNRVAMSVWNWASGW